jgi:hypothetical protein
MNFCFYQFQVYVWLTVAVNFVLTVLHPAAESDVRVSQVHAASVCRFVNCSVYTALCVEREREKIDCIMRSCIICTPLQI